jgi:branched-chain amino acid transport system substrate-binding protein
MDFADAVKKEYPGEKYVDVPYQVTAAAVMVWKDALERANSFDTEDLRAALAATDLETFYGRIKFAPTGEIITKPMILRQIQNGGYAVVWSKITHSGE